MMIKILKIISEYYQNLYVLLYNLINNFMQNEHYLSSTLNSIGDFGTLTPNGSFSMSMIQKVGTSFNHVGGFQ